MSVLNKYLSNFLMGLMLVVPLHAIAEEKPELLEQLYELSGLEQQFVYLGHTFTQEGLRMGRNELPDNDMSRQMLTRLEEGLSQKYAPEKLRTTVKQILNRELDALVMPDIVEVMQSKVWQKAVRLENLANNPENLKELEDYVTVRLQEKLPRQVRLDLVQQLVKKTDAVETTMNMMVAGAVSAAEIMLGSDTVPSRFEENMRTQMGQMKAEYEDMVTRQFLFTYRYMSDEQLEQYVQYYSKPEIQSLNKAVTLSLVEAFQ